MTYMDRKREFLDFEKIVSWTRFDPVPTEKFLEGLVRKGFLEERGLPEIKEYPFISIIIPVRNRPDEITECLESLLRVEYPPELMEIIVVDDASTDNTSEVVARLPGQSYHAQRAPPGFVLPQYCRQTGQGRDTCVY